MSEIEACRTCGIFFLVSSNFLRHLHSSEPEMLAVRQELEAWNVKLNEDDRFPQFICTVCLLEFRKIFKFQHACLETQEQLRQLYAIQQDNIKKMIKTELSDDIVVKKEPEYKSEDMDQPNVCAFIYIDDLSDSEYDNESDNSHNVPQFKVPHIPIKEEIIEEARVPLEDAQKNNDEHQRAEEMSVLALTPVQLTAQTEQDEIMEMSGSEQSNITSGIRCELCMQVSRDQQEHRQHLLRIHEAKPLTCHICGKRFKDGTTQTRFKYHLKWHRLNKHIKCPQCGFHCASRNVLNEHTRAVHTKTPCEICGKRFLPKRMRLHMEEHQITDIAAAHFECHYCPTDFTNEIERDQHILITHSEETTENRNFDSFNQDYINQEDNSQDSIMDSGSENGTPGFTDTASTLMSFSPDDRSEIGMQFYSTENERTDFEIECDDSYETSLENEMSTVNLTASVLDEMQFTCAQCPISFAKVEQLIAHAEVHQEKSLFCCNICGKKFDLKFSLNRHMKRHKNVTC